VSIPGQFVGMRLVTFGRASTPQASNFVLGIQQRHIPEAQQVIEPLTFQLSKEKRLIGRKPVYTLSNDPRMD
jgi:hypothetical protein